MASHFRRDDAVLYFNPRTPEGMRYAQGSRRFVLWPALMYRVVAPEVRERRLDVLQKAILGLACAGKSSAEQIGHRLHIDTDLAAFILLALKSRGFIGPTGQATHSGRDLLEEETLQSHRLVTGHVFQDPWSGDLWPRFIQHLDYAELEQNAKSGFPDIVLGTKGAPRRHTAFMVMPEQVPHHPLPSAAEILRASQRHQSSVRRSGDRGPVATSDDALSRAAQGVLGLISHVDEEPANVFVTSFIFTPEGNDDLDEAVDWYACDPFGVGLSPALRKALEREVRASEHLHAVLDGLLGSSLDHHIEAQHRAMESFRALAVERIEREMVVGAGDLPYYEQLVDLECARVEAELHGESFPRYKIRELLGTARRALEGAFNTILTQHPPQQVWRRVYADHKPVHDTHYCRDVYEASARLIGFASPIPARFANVKPNHVKAACYPEGSWRLRAAIIAAVLSARDDAAHPLHAAAANEPDLLPLLDSVIDVAGNAVHASMAPPSLDVALAAAADVQRAVHLLSGLGQRLANART
jgi:hypothetical protein